MLAAERPPMIESARRELAAAIETLAAAGVETARADAEWLLAHARGGRRLDVYLAPAREVPARWAERFRAAVRRRARHEPLQRILGWEDFCGLRLRLTRGVLIPRPETELLVEWALALLRQRDRRRRAVVVDVGTGAGGIACALAHGCLEARVIALDVSGEAAAVARDNARALGLGGRVSVAVADLLTALRAQGADLIVANPPYLPSGLWPTLAPEVREHDPRLAVDGGRDGLAVIRPLVAAAPGRLRPAGALVLETAGDPQTHEVVDLLRAAGFDDVDVRADLTGAPRFVAGRMPCV
jgi:release factor glutamine methyltransferase